MIKANFFPTVDPVPPRENVNGWSRTNTVNTLGNGFSAYWLGWMNWDNIPSTFKISDVSFSETKIEARIINTPKNSPVGYTTDSYDYAALYDGFVSENPFSVSSNQRAYMCYLNSLKCKANVLAPALVSTGSRPATAFKIVYDTGNTEALGTHNQTSMSFSGAGIDTLDKLVSFLRGEIDASFNFTINGVQIPITINANTLNEQYYAEFLGNANGVFYRICVFIAGYGSTPSGSRESDSPSAAVRMSHVTCCLKMFSENGNYYVNTPSGFYQHNFTFWSDLNSMQGGSNGKIDGLGFLNGFEFSIQKAELKAKQVRYAFTFNGNTCFQCNDNQGSFWVTRMYQPADILKHFALIFRLQTDGANSYGYHDGIYCPEVLDTGEFTGNLLTGELTENDVQPWQWEDITASDFTEDEIPDYEPPSPGVEGEESGDRIGNSTRLLSGATNFITQYAMTALEIEKFGSLLWTSWADGQGGLTDMWKNFKLFISSDPASDTGSIDIASVMDFIVSLQVFPFDMRIFSYTDVQNVCIGTGHYPLSVSAKKMLAINHIIDCGTVTIPRPYGDFRDYENMSISAYLPYCGTVELNPGDVIGRNVNINYSIDSLSGSCTAVLTVYDDGGYLYNVGMINGQISASIPVTATNSGQIRAQRIADVSSLAGLAGNFFVNNISRGANSGIGAKNVEPISAISGMAYGTASDTINMGTTLASTFAERFSRSAIACPTLAGGNGIAAFYQPACPYIQMRYGIYQYPANYKHSVGGVSSQSSKLSSYKGFTVCENVDTSGLTCHNDEKAAIKAALSAGVYL